MLPEADPPAELDEFTLILLTRPANAPALASAAAERLQRQHLGYLEAMRCHGFLLLSGPFADQPDESWRGLCIYRAPLDDARRLAENDPAVLRGRLAVTAFRWYTRKGALVIGG
jgi:uncharacterized protein YciI